MATTDKRVDAYIQKAEPFAQPILIHLRSLIHKACPDIEETIKWGFPHFQLNGIVCSMASFKQHCAFGFWKAAIMNDPDGVLEIQGRTAMGHLGNIRSLKDLPSDKVLLALIKEAVILNKEGVKLPGKTKTSAIVPLDKPPDLQKALSKNKAAREVFEAFSNSNKKEYIEWLEDAKSEATRQRRLETAMEWIAEGKIKNWKYVKK
jgi:uncharacterized protein YdeI (YjbR/CyaY-like superfamily)